MDLNDTQPHSLWMTLEVYILVKTTTLSHFWAFIASCSTPGQVAPELLQHLQSPHLPPAARRQLGAALARCVVSLCRAAETGGRGSGRELKGGQSFRVWLKHQGLGYCTKSVPDSVENRSSLHFGISHLAFF